MYKREIEADVVVVGGGMAGLCAAVASARRGASTVLIHDRPVLGGNASSEVRMWICGARGTHAREGGLLEEIKLDNARRNPGLRYSVWDQVLYEKASFQPNLTTLLNTSVTDGKTEGGRLQSLTAWQLTSQTWITVNARYFVDCSGDSILAPISGAATRWGREARAEFGESIAPIEPDGKTMGNTILMQLRRTDEEVPYVAPDWAYRFDSAEDIHGRLGTGVDARNFWWLELGGLDDTIADAEQIRHRLYRTVWGAWDYIKNRSPEKEKAARWAVEWVGSLPGKRENRRYVGPYTMTQNDVRAGVGWCDDAVAHGGWPMDDHHPAGLMFPGPPTIFHPAPSPYEIPWRCLFSSNVPNVMCAGRNISVTHAALSSTRVMGTCATIGQAAGTGAALCATTDRDPADIDVKLLQRQLVEDDQYIPTRLHDGGAVMAGATVTGEPELLGNPERDLEDERHGVELPVGEPVTLTLAQPMSISAVRLVLDSNFADGKPMPASYPLPHTERVVGTLLRDFTVEVRVDGAWQVVADVTDNHQRLVRPAFDPVTTDALRLTPRSTWSGSDKVRVFSFAALERLDVALPEIKTERFQDLVAAVPAADLAEPDPVDDADHDEAHGDPANMTTAAVRKKRGTLAGITSGA